MSNSLLNLSSLFSKLAHLLAHLLEINGLQSARELDFSVSDTIDRLVDVNYLR